MPAMVGLDPPESHRLSVPGGAAEDAVEPGHPASHDLAWVLQCAWSEIRLAKLQALVHTTIAELRQMDVSELLGRELTAGEAQFSANPVTEAGSACGHELCYEAGVPDALEKWTAHRNLVSRCSQSQPTSWQTTYEEALSKYRNAASRRLQSLIAREHAA